MGTYQGDIIVVPLTAARRRVLALLLVAVALVSLVVGDIGIMNIMLVSVSKRTRDILGQFLVKAVMLSLTGGLIGFAIGVFFGFFPARKAANPRSHRRGRPPWGGKIPA